MDILYLLIPMSIVLVLAIGAVFWWALQHRQFDDLEQQGAHILQDQDEPNPVPNKADKADTDSHTG